METTELRPFETTLEAVESLCRVISLTEDLNSLLLKSSDPNCFEVPPKVKEGSLAQRTLEKLDALRDEYRQRYRLTVELFPSFPLAVLAQEHDLSETETAVFQTTLALACRTTHRFEPSPTVGLVSRHVAGWSRSEAQSLLAYFTSGSKLMESGLIDVIQCRPTVADWVVFIPRHLLLSLLGCRREPRSVRPLPNKLQATMRQLSTSMPPLQFLPRFNAIAHAFKNERFAVLSAFRSGAPLELNLQSQSKLVDAVKEAGLGWFPLIFPWAGRSIFVHRVTETEARRLLNQHSGQVRSQMPEPTMELVLSLRKQVGFDRFIFGENGRYIVYGGDPPLPLSAGDKLWLNVDASFIRFREEQGHLVTQNPNDKERRGGSQ